MDTMAVKILRMMADLRTVIEERRKELNVTKQMLEENTGYGRHPYSNFIEGDSDISLSNFLRVCEYLHIYIGVEVNRNIKPFEKRPKGCPLKEVDR